MSELGTPTPADEVIAARVLIGALLVDGEQTVEALNDLHDAEDFQRVVGVITFLANNLAGAFEQITHSKERAIVIARQQLAEAQLRVEMENDE